MKIKSRMHYHWKSSKAEFWRLAFCKSSEEASWTPLLNPNEQKLQNKENYQDQSQSFF